MKEWKRWLQMMLLAAVLIATYCIPAFALITHVPPDAVGLPQFGNPVQYGAGGSYVITTPQQLLNMTDNKGTYTLGADLDMTGITYINPMSHFYGTFDGAGHTISNLTLNLESKSYTDSQGVYHEVPSPTPLFNWLDEGGTIKNVTLSNCTIDAKNEMFVAFFTDSNYGTIENCKIVNSSITAATNVETEYSKNRAIQSQLFVDGFVASGGKGIVRNCSAQMDIHIINSPGQGEISGVSGGFLSNCTSDCNIVVDKVEGSVEVGMFGRFYEAKNCTAKGSIKLLGTAPSAHPNSTLKPSAEVGGFTASVSGGSVLPSAINDKTLYHNVYDCTSAVNIDGGPVEGVYGGFVANYSGPLDCNGSNMISGCTASGSLTAKTGSGSREGIGRFVGSFVGQSLKNCKSTVIVNGSGSAPFAGKIRKYVLFENCE